MRDHGEKHLEWDEIQTEADCHKRDMLVIRAELKKAVAADRHKIVVLDDDPTGIQTVHGISVYTDWKMESIRAGFCEEGKMFFILTNSRSMTAEETRKIHHEIAERIMHVAEETKKKYLIVSRGDSTLRGHFPLETQLIREDIRSREGKDLDGEILCPYFREGGRFTLNDIHYVRCGRELIPAGETEFAQDETFGYHASNLREYVEEKTCGRIKAEQCLSIPLELLQAGETEETEKILLKCRDFQKVIVNAVSDDDLRVFCVALYHAMEKGKRFLFRCAASLVKIMADISDCPLLGHEDLFPGEDGTKPGIILVGSHTEKTTRQLEKLREMPGVEFLEMNSDLVLQPGELEKETEKILALEEEFLRQRKTVCIYTRRTVLKCQDDTPEKALKRSVKISLALQDCAGKLCQRPAFVIAKGGITSSDVGVRALRVKKAEAAGQIQPGIPVWKTGPESLFPGMPYVIFPGNVGEDDTLKKTVEILIGR